MFDRGAVVVFGCLVAGCGAGGGAPAGGDAVRGQDAEGVVDAGGDVNLAADVGPSTYTSCPPQSVGCTGAPSLTSGRPTMYDVRCLANASSFASNTAAMYVRSTSEFEALFVSADGGTVSGCHSVLPSNLDFSTHELILAKFPTGFGTDIQCVEETASAIVVGAIKHVTGAGSSPTIFGLVVPKSTKQVNANYCRETCTGACPS